MLVNKEIDVSAIGLLMMPERRVAVDLCYPTFSEEKTLMMAVSNKNKLNVWVFMEILPLPGRIFNHGINCHPWTRTMQITSKLCTPGLVTFIFAVP